MATLDQWNILASLDIYCKWSPAYAGMTEYGSTAQHKGR